MAAQKYRVGSKCATGQKIAQILGQSPDACVYTTTDGHLRWEHLRTKKLPAKLVPAITRFDRLMVRIRRLKGITDQTPIYDLLGKCLFTALDTNLAQSVNTVFRPVTDVLKEFENGGVNPRLRTNSKRVFLVHGHDDAAKEAVARFLAQLELEPVILHERASQGGTIIEKFEKEANAAFAIALLTPDDVGSVKSKKRSLTPRARQNVIFEFGFFVAALGRNRVVALHKGSVELPSDLTGVLYVPFDDSTAWKLLLARELKQAGISFDMNRVIS